MSTGVDPAILSMGIHNMWGFSPAFDVLDHLDPNTEDPQSEEDPINILLLCPSDIRHVLNTISCRKRKTSRPIHFYIYEQPIEALAREMLLLQIIHDWELPLRYRCNTFLEIYGNALLQSRTSAYVSEKAAQLADLVYDGTGPMADLFDFSQMKMKTRDDLVDVFESWKPNKMNFDMQELREHRLRGHYGARYDHRKNLIDWDYTMNLKPIEDARVIHIKQYRHWRETGVAFEFGDQEYTVANPSMASFAETKEKRTKCRSLRRGYWLDIVISPYISFGVNCYKANKYAEDLFDIHNKNTGVEQNRHNTVEVCVYNLLSYLQEIETGEVYKMKKPHEIYSGLDQNSSESKNGDNEDSLGEKDALARAEKILETFRGIKIMPLTMPPKELFQKKKFANKFDHVYLSGQMAHLLNHQDEEQSLTSVLRPNAHISVESSVFLFPLKKDQRIAYMNKIMEMANLRNFRPLFHFQSKEKTAAEADIENPKNAVLHFQYNGAEAY